VFYETHSHTPLCKHAVGEPEQYAEAARRGGLIGLVVTCHNPMPDGFSAGVRMREDQFDQYVDMVARARDAFAGTVDVRLGLEADYFEGYEGWLERQLQSADFHYVLGSVHPQIGEFKVRYHGQSPVELHRTYFGLLAQAAETRLFDCLAHPDLIKNETPHDWDPTLVWDDIRRALDRIAAAGTAMELNTSGVNKKVAEMNPFPAMLRAMRERGIPVVIGADAHEPGRVGDGFVEALALLEECGYREASFFLERRLQSVPIDAARKALGATADLTA
jgi:histidinol-phosphatase (PHP family)